MHGIAPRNRSPPSRATPFPLERAAVVGCLDVKERPTDALFQAAFERTFAALMPSRATLAFGAVRLRP
jgi:hypothetical protein